MKLKSNISAGMIFLVFSKFSLAAEKITEKPSLCDKISSVSLTRNVVSPDDAEYQIHAIADKKGADHYRVNYILPASRNGSSLRINADFYRCQL
ncbi:DUF1471 domain-containing protein [Enterobacter cloacae]|uniref:DUF1471 domain-containing protein n=1 Tax=Enterobacter cloacae TaxID=550 RepID=UPI0025409D74|nr:DUF1471 domain-containing protein [Enterobacter cloacae]WIF62922.1 DUF1471 domain-containing protein [Enterobacter cloacae]